MTQKRGKTGQLQLTPRPEKRPQEPTTVYPVSQLVRLAGRQLESHFGAVWVEGEVSNCKRPASGHIYLTLKDARAQLAVVLFRSTATKLRFRVEDGQKLRCHGRLSIYDQQGRFQLTADRAEPSGVGALQLAFEQLKDKLAGQGLFDDKHKKDLPRFPGRVAIVTSKTGAALRDILRVLEHRFPVRLLICPTPVQTGTAAPEIAMAIRRADRVCSDRDLIIVARGGGSIEDLWAFNTEEVARAIHAARTPIISGVGHEVDVTIADLVADRRAPTPSAAAEVAVPAKRDLQRQLDAARRRVDGSIRARLNRAELSLQRLLRRLGSPRQRIDGGRMRIDELVGRLDAASRRQLREQRKRVSGLAERLAARQPQARLATDRSVLANLEQRLIGQIRRRIDADLAALSKTAARLEALSPLAVLARGYSLVRDGDGQVVRNAAQVKKGQRLEVKLHRGELSCVVEEVPSDS